MCDMSHYIMSTPQYFIYVFFFKMIFLTYHFI